MALRVPATTSDNSLFVPNCSHVVFDLIWCKRALFALYQLCMMISPPLLLSFPFAHLSLSLCSICWPLCFLFLLAVWPYTFFFFLQGNTIESEHLSELTEEEYEAHIYQRQDLKGFMWLDAKYLNPFFTRRLTQEVRQRERQNSSESHGSTYCSQSKRTQSEDDTKEHYSKLTLFCYFT